MLIGGIQKFTALDYPDKIAATVFTVGCNFRCPYCHNGEIVDVKSGEFDVIDGTQILKFLQLRQGELDGVCISGGEPTLQPDLVEFIAKIKNLGFLVKLDTNGSNTQVVRELLDRGLVDYFAIDIKTSPDKYHMVNAYPGVFEKIMETVGLITDKGTSLELRTTVAPGVVGKEDFDSIVDAINSKSADIFPKLYRYSVQAFRPQKCLDKSFQEVNPYEDKALEEIAQKLRNYCGRVDVLK